MKVHVSLPNGTTRDFDTAPGQSLMVAMNRAGVPVRAECGGAMACATCHVLVDDAWMGQVGPAKELEGDLLNCLISRAPNSRLSCQVKLTESLDGLKVTLQPEAFEG
jgi:2Fe-2S ferredoxin